MNKAATIRFIVNSLKTRKKIIVNGKKNRNKQEKTTKFLYVDVALSEETCSW